MLTNYTTRTGTEERTTASQRRALPGGNAAGSLIFCLLFGGVFVAVGTAIALIGLKVIPIDPAGLHAPYWVLTVFGAVFAVAGLLVWFAGIQQSLVSRQRAQLAAAHPGEPAFADYPWDPRGWRPARWKPVMAGFGMAAFMTLFLSIFNFWAFGSGQGPFPVKLIVGLFDLVLLAVWWGAIQALAKAIKFGESFLRYSRIPYRPGETIDLVWEPPAGILQIESGTFALRCVAEWTETHGHGKNRSTHTYHQLKWEGSWQIESPTMLRRGAQVPLSFETPADLPGTCLGATPVIFWELGVKLQVPGLDFAADYLVPVYAPR